MPERERSPQSVVDICETHRGKPGALLPILREIQDRFGFISREAVAEIAAALNVTRADVDGVVSFYADFKTSPTAARVIKVCRAEACQANGGREVWDSAVAAAEASGGSVEVEAVYCLGNCACSPSAQLDGETLGRVNRERVAALIAGLGGEVAS